MLNKNQLIELYNAQKQRYYTELKNFLTIPSISADPQYEQKCTECAQWLKHHLTGMGCTVEVLQTSRKPVVYAHYEGPEQAPTIVYYGHYDVQPVDPIESWDSPPFEPEIRSNRIYARGAQDNKGQTFYFLKAVEALIHNQALPCSLKIFLEGEEETQSVGLTESIPKWKEKLQGDVLMVCDTGCAGPEYPTITMGLRGILQISIKMKGPLYDLHSGSFGGAVKNPALEMARLLSTLHKEDGQVAVKGFYEGANQFSKEDQALANATPVDLQALEEQLGTPLCGGEKGWTLQERIGLRPTLEINGLHSGYGGPGSKTIIPSQAIAKMTARLTGKQDPQKTLDAIVDHLTSHCPEGVELVIEDRAVGGQAVMLSSSSQWIQKAKGVLDQLTSHGTVFSWEGGSIPVVAELARASGAEPLLVGFGLEEDRIHAPNESFDLDQFQKGFLYAALFLQKTGD